MYFRQNSPQGPPVRVPAATKKRETETNKLRVLNGRSNCASSDKK
jgi:hypothetical protein